MTRGQAADHITPYDRMALDESVLVALLASRTRHESLVEYFGTALHDELVRLARAVKQRRARPGRRVYILPGIMGSQLGFPRGAQRPNDILWLDPIDFSVGRLTELTLLPGSRLVALGAMNYTYLKLALSLRKAGFDAVLFDYDWRQDVATVGRLLADRIAADGKESVAIIGHSMGGLVARAALTHPAGAQVSQLVMLGTPNGGSLAAVQAMRGTYSVVRKLAMMDREHDAEFLAGQVFASFPGLHELLPVTRDGMPDLFDPQTWPGDGPGPDPRLLRAAQGLPARLAAADQRFHLIIGCNQVTATGIARRANEFEYTYTLRGDGTVPMAMAQLDGAQQRFVNCDHSDLPLSDRVIAGTLDLLKTGRTRRLPLAPRIGRTLRRRVLDSELRREYLGKVDWAHMSPEERRVFLDTLNEPPRRMRQLGSAARPRRLHRARQLRQPRRRT